MAVSIADKKIAPSSRSRWLRDARFFVVVVVVVRLISFFVHFPTTSNGLIVCGTESTTE